MGTIQLTEHQKTGLLLLEKSFKENYISCLSGYAGTGKSTIIGEFVRSNGITPDQVVYLTFTGKASTVLQSKGLPSMTIHSFLYAWTVIEDDDGKKKFIATKRQPDEFPSIKLIVIDEISMVNDELLSDILEFLLASKGRIKLICLGDIGQLPPVDESKSKLSKKILKDSVFNLEEFMRFSESSGIYELSDRVRKGLPLKLGTYQGCKVVKGSPKLIRSFLRKKNSQILVTTNKTRFDINKMARDMFGYDSPVPEVGEKVIFTHNNRDIISSDYKLPIMNGVLGTVQEVLGSHTEIHSVGVFKTTVNSNGSIFKNVWVDSDNFLEMANGTNPELDLKRKLTYVSNQEEYFISKLNTLDFAYSITVHKSQGSEFEEVLFIAEKWGSPKFVRKLLYTGITRATKNITIMI